MMTRILTRGYLWLLLALLYSPILIIMIFSFTEAKVLGNWTGFSTKLYSSLFTGGMHHSLMNAIWNTFAIALLAATASTALGSIAAIGIFNLRSRTRQVMNFANAIPMMNADIITCLLYTSHTASRISVISGNGPHIDNMTTATLHHTGNHEAGHGKQGFHVSIDDNVPFIQIAFMFLVHPNDESGIVHQYVYRLPFLRKGFEGGTGSLPVADIERKQIHIGSIFLQQFFLYSIQFLHITAIEYKPCLLYTSRCV